MAAPNLTLRSAIRAEILARLAADATVIALCPAESHTSARTVKVFPNELPLINVTTPGTTRRPRKPGATELTCQQTVVLECWAGGDPRTDTEEDVMAAADALEEAAVAAIWGTDFNQLIEEIESVKTDTAGSAESSGEPAGPNQAPEVKLYARAVATLEINVGAVYDPTIVDQLLAVHVDVDLLEGEGADAAPDGDVDVALTIPIEQDP